MANIKKSRSQRKKVMSFSVKTAIAEEFTDICRVSGKIPSHTIEEMIRNFINVYNKNNEK